MPVYASGEVNYGAADPASADQGYGNMNALMQAYAQRQAGADMAGGDTTGAANALYRSGNLAGGEALQDRQHAATLESQKEETQFILDAATSLKQVADAGGDPLDAFDKLTPVFKAREGVDDNMIAMLRQQLATNPKLFLDSMTAHAQQALIKLSNGDAIYDPNNKKLLYQMPDVHDVAPGHSLVDTAGSGGGNGGAAAGVGQGGSPPAAGQPSAGAMAPQPGQPAAVAANAPPPPPPTGGGQPAPMLAPALLRQIRANPNAFWSQALGRDITLGPDEGFRTPVQNRKAGGSATSEHLTNSAWDIPISQMGGMTSEQLTAQLAASGMPFDQIIDEGDHVHFGIGPRMRGEVLQKVPGGYRHVGTRTQQASAPASAQAAQASISPGGARVLFQAPEAPGTDKGFTLGPGQVHFDAQGNRVASVAPKPAAGAGKLPTQDAARLKAMDTMLLNAETLGDMSHDFITRMGNFQTGWQYNRFGGHTSAAGSQGGIQPGQVYNQILDPAAASKVQELQGITNRATPMLRPTGSGRILSSEYANFARAFPSVSNTVQANRQLDQEYQQQRQGIRSMVQFYHKWAHDHGNLDEADAAWAAQRGSASGGGRTRVWDPVKGLQ